LTDLTAGAAAMTVSESSMGVDEGEIIVNETGLIAFVWSFVFRFMPYIGHGAVHSNGIGFRDVLMS